ncbi:MAG: rod-binding protein [Defluviitaleaceae bacterium]|nr:rod-binding protein [Defluviitaleaceae bacterium]MCL2835503.1 rod-binding protein [Defluviitaleaceae bacterium]
MSISIGNIPAYVPPSSAYVAEAATHLQSEMAKTDNLVNDIRNAQSGECPVALMDACKAFESYFLQIMFKEMRNTIPEAKDGFFVKSNAEKIFEGMLDEQMSIMAANNGGIGLAAFMFRQMQREGLTYENAGSLGQGQPE